MDRNTIKWLLFIAFLFTSLLLFGQPANKLENREKVKQLILKYDIKHPDIVLRQAMFETGWLTCTNCSWQYNNAFGFFWKGSYLKYDSLEESVAYYKWWQDKLYKGGDYYAFLKRVGYATKVNYNEELKKMW
jgi:hypothetical protein